MLELTGLVRRLFSSAGASPREELLTPLPFGGEALDPHLGMSYQKAPLCLLIFMPKSILKYL